MILLILWALILLYLLIRGTYVALWDLILWFSSTIEYSEGLDIAVTVAAVLLAMLMMYLPLALGGSRK